MWSKAFRAFLRAIVAEDEKDRASPNSTGRSGRVGRTLVGRATAGQSPSTRGKPGPAVQASGGKRETNVRTPALIMRCEKLPGLPSGLRIGWLGVFGVSPLPPVRTG